MIQAWWEHSLPDPGERDLRSVLQRVGRRGKLDRRSREPPEKSVLSSLDGSAACIHAAWLGLWLRKAESGMVSLGQQ